MLDFLILQERYKNFLIFISFLRGFFIYALFKSSLRDCWNEMRLIISDEIRAAIYI